MIIHYTPREDDTLDFFEAVIPQEKIWARIYPVIGLLLNILALLALAVVSALIFGKIALAVIVFMLAAYNGRLIYYTTTSRHSQLRAAANAAKLWPTTVEFRDDGILETSQDITCYAPWKNVTNVKKTSINIILSLNNGQYVVIPHSSLAEHNTTSLALMDKISTWIRKSKAGSELAS